MTRCQRGARSRGPWDAKCTIDRKRSYSKGFLGIDPPLWLGYIRQYLVTLLPAVQHPMALELSLDVLAPLVSYTMAQFPSPLPPPCYLLIVCIFQMESILRVPSIVIFLQV